MKIKGLETSKNLLKLTGEYISSEDEEDDLGEESKTGPANQNKTAAGALDQQFEESKAASLTELPEDYDLVEEVPDEECA